MIENFRNRFSPKWNPMGWGIACGLIELCTFISKELVVKNNKLKLVEVGSLLGESTCIFASFGIFEKIWAVDIWLEEEKYNIFKDNAKMYPNIITPIHSTSEVAAKEWKGGVVDVIYIDANHSYESVVNDINYWKPYLSPGGIISGHDYNNISWPGVVRAVDESFPGYIINRFRDTSWAIKL